MSNHTTSTSPYEFYKTLDQSEKKQIIQEAAVAFGKFLEALRVDWKNDHESSSTPERVAKMYVNDILQGRFNEKPSVQKIELQENFNNTLKIFGPIPIRSICVHHYMPFFGSMIIGISGPDVLGISKYTKICNWYAKRAQIQEKLGEDILQELKAIHSKSEVAVFMQAKHTCVSHTDTGESSCQLQTLHSTPNFHENNANFLSTCLQML